jgi:hypothetical protein
MPRLIENFTKGSKGITYGLGYNSVLMTYGQTGSGKTHTLFGAPEFWKNSN